jgi:Phosphotransferase enzyme family
VSVASSRMRVREHSPSIAAAPVMRWAHGWLPAVVPAGARRFRVADPGLGETLAGAGAELVDHEPDVEIGRNAAHFHGDASFAIHRVIGPASKPGSRAVRIGRRVGHSLVARSRARRARRALRAVGYEDAGVVFWDLGGRVALDGIVAGSGSLSERLSRYALVLGRRGETEPTAVAAALQAAGRPQARWASVQSGLVVVGADDVLLRVAIGRSVMQIDNAASALERLRGHELPDVLAERVPWPLARGREGLADWSLEPLLPGTRAPRDVPGPLLDDCLDFLVALGRVRSDDRGRSFTELAETVARVLTPGGAAAAHEVAGALERSLAGVERCFAHGDFFSGNLLAEGGRLSGVVDWDSAAPGRLPLLDLLHLLLTRAGALADDEWGNAVLERLLPLARAGGDDAIRRYCAEVGVPAEPRTLEAFVWAYWLDYAAYQLRTHLLRQSQPRWIEQNVERMARSAAEALAH